MPTYIQLLSLPFILTMGCDVGLTTTSVKVYDSGLDADVEPSSEPATEETNDSASEPSMEPSGEPSTEQGDLDSDDDGDGFSENLGDCDDNNPNIGPHATEIANDDFDQNCDGKELCYQDSDGDGYATETVILSSDPLCGNDGAEANAGSPTTDCDDYDPTVFPMATDTPNDGIDQDCDGIDSGNGIADQDGDGYDSSVDCNDYDASINPGAYDTPNDGIDQNCDGSDATTGGYPDVDGDGFDSSIDCNDYDPSINPMAIDIPNDGIDQDCDGSDATTGGSCSSLEMFDCNRNCAPTIWYGDGICNSGVDTWNGNVVDYNCGTLYYENGDCSATFTDYDFDGYDSSVDCDDYDPYINPGAYDIPNDGIDQDCDGSDATTGGGGCLSTEIVDCNGACAPDYWLGDGTCDQGQFTYGSNYIDLNCSLHSFDNGDCAAISTDYDFDGYDSSVDCDDYDPYINPGAYDIPNDGIDQDCDGSDATTGGTGPQYYSGSESLQLALGGFYSGQYNCDMQFSVIGSPSTTTCANCDYVFDMNITMGFSSVYDSNCSALTSTMTVPYGFVNNYNSSGEQALLLYENGSWVPFAINNNISYNMLDSVSFDGTSFNYSVGHLNYYAYSSAYGWGYFSNHWSGSGIAY